MIKVTSLNKYYNKGKSNEIHVINDVNITLPDNGIVAFLGHSGSGKTTLLNVIGGLDKANGTIEYDGMEVKNYNARKIDDYRNNHIGYVFQNYNLLPDETIYDNLRIALELIGINDKEEVDRRIEYTLKAVGMFKFRKKKAYALSGGQQQRVSIARALLKNCKILIADEPTGNLDSSNTIDVMNVLKKVSRNTLVLLVTHEEDMANFYADYIFRIKDGKIESEEKNESSGGLERENGNIAYLQDMNVKEASTPIGDFKVYFENETIPANLTFIVKNNTLYLQSDQPIKMAADSSLKIVDGHKKVIEKKEVEDFEYDTSFYQPKSVKKNWFKIWWTRLKDSFFKFRNVKKRVRFMYTALAAIGFVFAIAVLAFGNYSHNNDSGTYYNKNYSTFTVYNYSDNLSEYLEKALTDGAVSEVYAYSHQNVNHKESKTLIKYYSSFDNAMALPYDENQVTLYKGEKITASNEVIISKNIADGFIEDCRLSGYDELLNSTLKFGFYSSASEDYIIKGISENDSHMIYLDMNTFISYVFGDSDTNVYYGYGETEKGHYTVTEGTDLDYSETAANEILATSDVYELGKQIEIDGEIYTMTGCIESRFGNTMYLLNKKTADLSELFSEYNDVTKTTGTYYNNICCGYTLSSGKYIITEGNDIAAHNETLIPAYYEDVKIGDTYLGRKVVGKYLGDAEVAQYSCIVTPDIYFVNRSDSYNNFYFTIKDNEKFASYFSGTEIEYDNSYDSAISSVKAARKQTATIWGIVCIALFAVATIFIYFIMRSKMIADINTLGIYRCLGMKKHKIIERYVSDSFVLSLFTTIIGYYVCVLGYYVIQLFTALIDDEILVMNWPLTVAGSFVILLISTLLGVLPVAILVRLTPAEIMSKYDI